MTNGQCQTVVLELNGLEVFAQKMFPSFSFGIEWPGTAAEFISAAVIAGKNYQKLKLIKSCGNPFSYPYFIIFLLVSSPIPPSWMCARHGIQIRPCSPPPVF